MILLLYTEAFEFEEEEAMVFADYYCDLEKIEKMRQEGAKINKEKGSSSSGRFYYFISSSKKRQNNDPRVQELEKKIANDLAKLRKPEDPKLKYATYGLSKGQDILLTAAAGMVKAV